MIYDLNESFELPQLHDEQITAIKILNQELVVSFDRITALNQKFFKSDRFSIVFTGIANPDTDIEFFVFKIKTDLSIIGTKYLGENFISWFTKENLKIEIVDIMSKRRRIQINGYILMGGHYMKQISMVVSAQKIIYE